MIHKAFADIFMSYEDALQLSEMRGNWKDICVAQWYISSLDFTFNPWDASGIWTYIIWLSSFWWQKKIDIYKMWTLNHTEGNGIDSSGIFQIIDGKNYIPTLWDYVVAKINQENNYIQELFLKESDSISEINTFSNSFNLSFCSEKSLLPPSEKNTSYHIEIIVFLILMILLLAYQLVKKIK